jgi:hypothetical protein
VPITPQQLAKKGDEHSHQVALFQWVAVTAAKRYPATILLHAIPNGAKLMGIGTVEGRIEGAKMKAEGVRSGVPDTFLPVPRLTNQRADGYYPGLYIELKKPGREREKWGARSEDQVKWQRDLLAQGFAVVTAYGWCASAQAIADYMDGKMLAAEDGDCRFYLDQPNPPW